MMRKRRVCVNCFTAFTYVQGPVLCAVCGGIQGTTAPIKRSDDRKPKTCTYRSKEEQGRIAWKALHEYDQDGEWDAWSCEFWYYSVWYHMIPRYCVCKEKWKKIEKSFPPDFSSRQAFRKWGIDAHNLVNEGLKRPIYHQPRIENLSKTYQKVITTY